MTYTQAFVSSKAPYSGVNDLNGHSYGDVEQEYFIKGAEMMIQHMGKFAAFYVNQLDDNMPDEFTTWDQLIDMYFKQLNK